MNSEETATYKEQCVKVGEGSGVLVNAMTEKYSYIFTAKHNLEYKIEDKQTGSTITKLQLPKNVLIFDYSGIKYIAKDYVYSSSLDILILIIDYKPDCSTRIYQKLLTDRDETRLCGFPTSKRASDKAVKDEYSSYILPFHEHHKESNIYELSNKNHAAKNNIDGYSGGPVYIKENAHWFLCAIENQMADIKKITHNRINAFSVSVFIELIQKSQYNEELLAPLLPLHLKSFDRLIDHIFNFDVVWDSDIKLDLVKNSLKNIARNEIVPVDIKPHEILKQYKDSFKIYERSVQELYDLRLWASFLELLVVSILLDKPTKIDMNFIKLSINSRRLIYIPEDKQWKAFLREILLSDLPGVDDDGIMVVVTNKASTCKKYTSERLKKIWNLKNISTPSSDPRLITNLQKNTVKQRVLVDLKAIHNHVTTDDNEQLFEDYDPFENDGIELVVENEYAKYLNKRHLQNDNDK